MNPHHNFEGCHIVVARIIWDGTNQKEVDAFCGNTNGRQDLLKRIDPPRIFTKAADGCIGLSAP